MSWLTPQVACPGLAHGQPNASIKVVRRRVAMAGRTISLQEPGHRISNASTSLVRRPPMLAFERSTSLPETVSDMKETFPHFASAWNDAVTAGSDHITCGQAAEAVSKLLTIPKSGVEELCKRIVGENHIFTFRQFCELIHKAQSSGRVDPSFSNPQEQPQGLEVEELHALSASKLQHRSPYHEERTSPASAASKGSFSQAGAAVLTGSSKSSPPTPEGSMDARADGSASSHMFTKNQHKWQTIRTSEKQVDVKYVSALQFSPDSKNLAAAYLDGGVEVYEALGRVTCRFASKLSLTNLKWQPGTTSRIVATTDTSGCLCVYDLSSKILAEAECVASAKCGYGTAALAFSGDGSRIFTSGADRSIKCFDLKQGLGTDAELVASQSASCDVNLPGMISGHFLRVRSLCAHPHNRDIIISAGLDNQTLLWDLRSGTVPVGIIHGAALKGDTLSVSRDGNTLFTASHCTAGDAFKIFDLRISCSKCGEKQGLKSRYRKVSEPLRSFCWSGDEDSGDGRRCTRCEVFTAGLDMSEEMLVAGGENDNLARIYEVPHDIDGPLHVVSTLKEDRAFVSSSISPDGRNVAFGTSSGKLLLAQTRQLAL
eukprot:TRINITY_DN12339_c0_g1_i2.p1 TRINITY_DN12339_c0_g1~~TRINITY_DN12339_c0_g1_i2.p1  ORF type:complete len:600 (+),score=97.29 TRINITY_DN12339_c0_g1_i2:67-1866(+)